MTNVVSLFAKKSETKEEDKKEEVEGTNFDSVMEHNKKNKDRLEKERSQANKSVLRSYRIKN